jgi:hypothetical protein
MDVIICLSRSVSCSCTDSTIDCNVGESVENIIFGGSSLG